MVAPATFDIAGYVVGSRPQLAVSSDGALAAVADSVRVAAIDLTTHQVLVDLAAESDETDVGWLGTPSMLLVVTRESQGSRLQLIDPGGGRAVAELRLGVRLRLVATTGAYALAFAPMGALVLHAGASHLTRYEIPGRTVPVAGGAGPRELLIAQPNGTIDEWDPQQRAPRRRLRLPRPAVIAALGAGPRAVWFATQQDPHRVELIPSVNRGHPTVHELPEPAVRLCGHPGTSDLVCVGRSGKLHRIDLDGRMPLATLDLGVDTVDAAALVVGHTTGVLLARTGQPLALAGSERGPGPIAAVVEASPAIEAAAPPSSRAMSSLAIQAPPEVKTPSVPPAPVQAPPVRLTLHAPPEVASQVPPASTLQAPFVVAPPPAQPALALHAAPVSLAALAPRTDRRRAERGEYETVLDHYRRTVFALAALAIARDWDSGRLAFATQDRPPFEAEVLALVGRGGGLAAQRVSEAAAAFQEASQALRSARGALSGRMSPIDLLCAEHGVSKTGELVLVAIAAPALWGEIARLYGILANDGTRATCDELLLVQLLRDTVPRREIVRELDPSAPLVRAGLIRASERPRPFQALGVDPIVAKLIADLDVDADVEPGVECVPASVPLERLVAPRAVIERALAELSVAQPARARIVVRGRTGVGRRTLLAALAEQAGRTLATIDAHALIRDKQVATLATVLQRVHLRGWLPCIDGIETLGSEDVAVRGQIRDVLREHAGPLALRLPPHAQPPLAPGYVQIELPTPTLTERASEWASELANRGLAARDLDALAARFTVGVGTIRRVVEFVSSQPPADVYLAIEAAMRKHL
ncbi:MAG TPA: hypothetical protein VK932_01545, partial [Kofleriaceae bacterium]|nr:hypothetical protein [Kofleriaceae bacterium]